MAVVSADRERATSASDPSPERDPVIEGWLTAIEAASRPPDELLRQSLHTVFELQRGNYLSEAEATELLKRIAAASVQRYVSDAICHFLDPDVIHGASRWRGSRSFLMSQHVRRHIRPALGR